MTNKVLGASTTNGFLGVSPDWANISCPNGRTLQSILTNGTVQYWRVEDTKKTGGELLASGNYANPVSVAGNSLDNANAIKAILVSEGLSGEYGYFVDGFTINDPLDVGIDSNFQFWKYAGAETLPYAVPQGTDPSAGDWDLVNFNSADAVILQSGETVQKFTDDTNDALPYVKKLDSSSNQGLSNKAAISFMFDDGYPSASGSVRTAFSERGLTCSLALNGGLLSRSDRSSITDLLDMQKDGFEICNHGLGSRLINSSSDPDTLVESEINGGIFALNSLGFEVQGFNAVSSSLAPEHIPKVKENHAYAISQSAINTPTISALQNNNDAYLLHRTSLNAIGLQGAKDLVDLAVANSGWVCFYDHDPDKIDFPSSMSLNELEELLDYILSLGVDVKNYRDALNSVNSRVIRGRDIENTSLTVTKLESRNLLKDSNFDYISLPTDSGVKSWILDNTINSNVTVTKNKGIFNTALISIDAGATSGRVILDNRLTTISSGNYKAGVLTFQQSFKGKNSATSTNLTVTMGINILNSSNTVINSVESDPLTLDGVVRDYYVSIDNIEYSENVKVQVFTRVVPNTNVADKVEVSQPNLYKGNAYKSFNHGEDFSTTEFVTNFGESVLIDNVETTLSINSSEDVLFSSSGNRLTAKSSGMFSFIANLRAISASIFTGDRFVIGVSINGATYSRRVEIYATQDGRVNIQHNAVIYLDEGDYVEYKLFQNSGNITISNQSPIYSGLQIAKL